MRRTPWLEVPLWVLLKQPHVTYFGARYSKTLREDVDALQVGLRSEIETGSCTRIWRRVSWSSMAGLMQLTVQMSSTSPGYRRAERRDGIRGPVAGTNPSGGPHRRTRAGVALTMSTRRGIGNHE